VRAVEFTARWTLAIGGGIYQFNFMLERRLCQSFVQMTRLTCSIFRAITMAARSISQFKIFKDFCQTPNMRAWILVGLIPCPPKDAKNIDETWHSMVAIVLFQLRHLDITGPGLKWDSADGFQWQWYPLLATWVGDYWEQVMVAPVSYGSYPMWEICKGAPMGHSTLRALDKSSD